MTPVTACLVWAAIGQALLTLVLLMRLGSVRFRIGKTGAVNLKEVAVNSDAWPREARIAGNAVRNQFEVPVLFFAVVALAAGLGLADAVFAGLAWLFVALRVAHAIIHIRDRNVMHRFQVFLAGVVTVSVLWVWLAIRITAL